MDEFTDTELTYKNGYNQALSDVETLLKQKIDDQTKFYGKYYKFAVYDSIDKTVMELKKGT